MSAEAERAAANSDTPEQSTVGGRFVGAFGIVVSALLMILAFFTLFYVIVQFWPPTTGTAGAAASLPAISLFGATLDLSRDFRLFVIVGVAGALGGLVHGLQSFSWYVGNRSLRRSWLPMYLLLPFTGASLAVIFYLVLRGGLISPQANSQDVSPFGIAAISALVGLFSEQAAQKLKQVFETLLTPAPKGADHVAANPVKIDSVVPNEGEPGATVVISGSGFSGTTSVDFSGVPAVPIPVSDRRIDVKVPDGAASGLISVTTGTGSAKSPNSFNVLKRSEVSSAPDRAALAGAPTGGQ